MTSQEAFEKVWLPYELPKNYVSRPDLIASYFWQAAQANQAEYIALLELNNKFKDDANAQLQVKIDTILITAKALANEVRMSQPQRDVMTGFVAGVKEALGETK